MFVLVNHADAAQHNNPVCLELEQHLQHHLDNGEGGPQGLGRISQAAMYAMANKPNKITVSSKSSRMSDVVTKDMLVLDFRTRVLTGVKGVYGELNEEGEINAEQFYNLKESADEVRPRCTSGCLGQGTLCAGPWVSEHPCIIVCLRMAVCQS